MEDRATVERLRAARSAPPAVETEEALARLESSLFAAPRARRLLDRYSLLRRLGQGTSGVVYLAIDPKLDRNVAIKLLHPRGVTAEGHTEGRARLLREAQAMARSPHPNVVAVYDVGTYDTEAGEAGLFLVMEYVEGTTLQAWLTSAKRGWHEVLEAFLAAGRGLAAAHHVGVAHRDFKPANAIVGDDARVRVLDFGLARGLDREEDITLPGDASFDAKLALDGALTAEGTVLGTPAFMAPEQHVGRPADASSDQYSFCVALWEGLYGARPFSGRSFEELAVAKRRGPPSVPSSPRDVPRRLGLVLARGLAVDPKQRWPTMEELLDALRDAATRKPMRGRVVLVACGTATLAAGGWLLLRQEGPCSGADERTATVWNADRRAAIAEAFEAAALPYGSESLDRVTQRIDTFADAWTRQHREACEARDALDVRMACLDRQLREADAMLSLLETADASTVERAADAVARLPMPTACDEVDALLADVSLPADPVLAAVVEAERAELARVKAFDAVGRVADGFELVRAVSERAETLGYAPLLAEALYLRAGFEDQAGRGDESLETLTRSHTIAVDAGHDRQAAMSSTQLVFVYGHRRHKLDEALKWAQQAEAELQRAHMTDRSWLLIAEASAYHAAGRWAEVESRLSEAIAIIEQKNGPDHPRLGVAHNNLGLTLEEMGDFARARQELELALSIHEKTRGPDHLEVANTLGNLASIDNQTEDLERAEQGFRRALEIRERALGSEHVEVAAALANLGVVLRKRGDLAGAREVYERSLVLLRRAGPDDPRTATVLLGLGKVEEDGGDLEAALQHYSRALAVMEAELPADHIDIARALHNRAMVLVRVGDLEVARSSFERADAIKQRGHANDKWIATGRFDFARLLYDRGEHAEAVAWARRAIAELPAEDAPELRRDVAGWLAERRYPEASAASGL